MPVDSQILLKRLEPVVRPTGVVRTQPVRPMEQADFDELLARAGRGELASGRRIDDSVLVEPLDPEFTERMGRVADAAEAAGFERVLVVVDERPLLLDISDRKLERELNVAEDEQLHRVDAAVRLIGEEERQQHAPGPEGPRNTQVPPVIAEAILNRNETSHGDRDEAA